MGKTRLFAIIVAFLIVVILAVLLFPGSEPQPEPKEEEPMVPVAAARMEIPAYTFITEEMVYLKEVPESSVHANDISSLEDVIGKRSLVTIAVDEEIMLNHIIDPDAPENRLAYKLEEGMRAMTIAVDDSSGVCSQIRAGDFVDVIVCVNLTTPENNDKNRGDGENGDDEEDPYRELDEQTLEIIKTIGKTVYQVSMQNIEVLALDQDQLYAPKQEDTGLYYYRTVTLAIPAEDCQKLVWAEYEGRIYLALRGENDDGRIETELYGTAKALLEEGDGSPWQ